MLESSLTCFAAIAQIDPIRRSPERARSRSSWHGGMVDWFNSRRLYSSIRHVLLVEQEKSYYAPLKRESN